MKGRKIIKRLLAVMIAMLLVVSYVPVAFAADVASDKTVETLFAELEEEAEFEDEATPLDSAPDADNSVVGTTPFGVLSAIGSYSLLIPAVLLAAIALIIAAIFRRKEKAATVK